MTPKNLDLEHILTRGVAEIIVKEEFEEKLASGMKLRLKLGFDPSKPDLHIGHGVVLRKLRQLQELGHQVVLVVGDWTAQIGDPSGRDETRTMLTPQEVKANAQTYMEQFFMIVDEEHTEVRWQSEWYEGFTLADVFNLASRFTLGQLMAHETFRKRYEEGLPLTVMELMYPLLQAYDSVAIEADVEFGGTDQKFNNLAGRELQRMMGLPPQDVFLVPLLPGTDGRKMGKTFDNTINFVDPPDKMYGKVMSITDEMLIPYFTLTTDLPDEEIEEMSRALEEGTVNPRDLKMRLAREIVNQLHPKKTRTISFTLDAILGRSLVDLLVDRGLAASESEATSLIKQGRVLLDGKQVRDTHYMITDQAEHTIERRGITHAQEAEREFIRIFREGELPSEIPTIAFSLVAAEPPNRTADGQIIVALDFGFRSGIVQMPTGYLASPTANSLKCSVVDILYHLGLTQSKSEARRLIQQEGVRLDGEKIEAEQIDLPLDRDSVLQVGKRKFVKLVPSE